MNSTSLLPSHSRPGRRGVLLIVVLSMLTLFLMLGAAYLAMASRSREIARAFSRLTADSAETRIDHGHFLDATLMAVLRGGPTVQISSGTARSILSGTMNYRFEPLLADRYGSDQTLSGSATITGTTAPLLTATVTLSGTTHPALLNGRILTFTPPGGDTTSHRILRATSGAGAYTVTLGPPHGRASFPSPPADSPVVINGLEFSTEGPENEEFDGFDMARNPFLAYVSLGDLPSQAICNKMSFIRPLDLGDADDALIQFDADPATMLPIAADNDNDGEPDGVFLDFGFPTVTTAGGKEIQLDASVLIVDLDSRFNINAHGSLASRLYHSASGTHSGWTTSGTAPFGTAATGTNIYVPLGSGYGPAETNGDKLSFSQTFRFSPSANPTEGQDPWIFSQLGGDPACQVGTYTFGSRYSFGSFTPRMPALEGRLGGNPPSGTSGWNIFNSFMSSLTVGLPGKSGTNDLVSATGDTFRAYSGTSGTMSSGTGSKILGVPATWWSGTSAQPGAAAREIYNSPPDLHGRLKVFTEVSGTGAAVPTLSLAKPEWLRETTDDPYEVRLAENARRAGAPDAAAQPDDVPYTYAELEKILRPYDADSGMLPGRLATVLGSAAEEGRLLFTTDSWDTTVITGSAAKRIRNWIGGVPSGTTALYGVTTGSAAPVTGILSGELARGEKFDLSRPLQSDKPLVSGTAGVTKYQNGHPYYVQRQAYFKDLFTLLCALSGTATAPGNHRELAQWAANVVEFADADSAMTPFEYDRNPSNGWSSDGNFASTGDAEREVVFGAERPELVFTEAYAWENTSSGTTTNSLMVALHRPWAVKALSQSGTVAGEPCDPDLSYTGTNTSFNSGTSNRLDLGKRFGTNGYPIWRLRVKRGPNTSIIRFDDTSGTSGTGSEYRARVSGSTTPLVETNTTLLVYGTAAYRNDSGWTPIPPHSGSAVVTAVTTGSLPLPGTSGGTVEIFLERLSDPTGEVDAGTWGDNASVTAAAMASGTSGVVIKAPMYRIVDSISCDVDPINGNGGPAAKKQTRRMTAATTSFWKREFQELAVGTFGSAISTAANAAWFHWPNRPLISPIELFLVRNGDAATWLDSYAKFTSGSNSLRDFDPQLRLLSAASVPTRFAGIHTTLPANGWTQTGHESTTGIYRVIREINQLSAYREPGRMNLNTVVGYPDPADPAKMESDVWNALVAGPLPSPPSPYDSAPFAGRLRRKLTQSALPAQPKLGIPATPAVPGRGNKKQAQQNVAGPSNPADSLAMAIMSISGTDSYVSTIRTGTTVTTSTNALMRNAIDRNPWHGIYTAMRLANTATVRSHVFGIWVTLREAVPGDPDSAKLHRAFYIVDRSIPVGYEPGKDHNVRDAIRVRRIVE